ncbi:MAG: type II secretion system F family protein [Mycobacteriales bacterium]|nr:type II secretion system F family protein [Mycobacteriales bacterium]
MTAVALAAVLAALSAGLSVSGGLAGAQGRGVLTPGAAVPRRAPEWVRHPAVLAGTVAAGGLLLGGPVAALLAPVAALVVRSARRERTRAVRTAREQRRAVEAVQALGSELRAGRTPGDALGVAAEQATGPVGTALRRASQAASLGGDVPAALMSTDGCALLGSLAVCWRVCSGTGSGLAAAVERIAEGLVADADRRRALESELAGPRATAGLLAVLPVAGVGLAAGLGGDPLQVLLHTPVGAVCLVAGVVLDLLGLLWTRALVRRALAA